MDVIDVQFALDWLFSLTEFDPFNIKFMEVRYDTTNFFIELGVFFFLIVCYPLVLLLK